MSEPIQLTLYSRPGCHLCEVMKAVIAELAGEFPHRLEEVDISRDPMLEARYGEQIPVLWVNGRKAFKYRVSVEQLRRRLQAEA